MDSQKKILILGAGFGGVRAALDLAKLGNKCQITLVNNNPFHTYIPNLYEVANAFMSKNTRQDYKNLASTVNIPLKTIFQNKPVKLIEDQVLGFDLEKKQVKLTGQSLDYDYLVVALGSTTNYYGIKGATEYSHPLKSLEDALNVRDDIQEKLAQHRQNLADKPFMVAIAGAGFTGVEFAGKLAGILKGGAEVVMLEGSKTVLPGMPAWAQARALKRLTKLRIKVKLNWLIGQVSSDLITSSTGEETLPYDYLVWTTGVRGAELVELKGIEQTKRGQLQVTNNLNILDHPEVFVVGDLAEYFDKPRNSYAPPAAWAAIGQTEVAAKNVKALLLNQKLSAYDLPKSAFIVPINRYFAISNWLGLSWVGLIPWIMKHLVTAKYLFQILPPLTAFKIWLRGVKIWLS